MSEIIVLKEIVFDPDPESLFKRLRLPENASDAADFEGILKEAVAVARPKGIYKVAFVEEKGEDFVSLDSIRLTSRVMRVNLENKQRAFPMIATCGREIEEWSKGIKDMLHQFWVDMIMESALRTAASTVFEHIRESFGLKHTSYMSPGSIDDWPLREQRRLFELLGDPEEIIGVELNENFLMSPTKTVSRLVFSSEEGYENCQLCPREGHCPSRRAPFDPDLYARKYGINNEKHGD